MSYTNFLVQWERGSHLLWMASWVSLAILGFYNAHIRTRLISSFLKGPFNFYFFVVACASSRFMEGYATRRVGELEIASINYFNLLNPPPKNSSMTETTPTSRNKERDSPELEDSVSI
jgi:hypothetical protein